MRVRTVWRGEIPPSKRSRLRAVRAGRSQRGGGKGERVQGVGVKGVVNRGVPQSKPGPRNEGRRPASSRRRRDTVVDRGVEGWAIGGIEHRVNTRSEVRGVSGKNV